LFLCCVFFLLDYLFFPFLLTSLLSHLLSPFHSKYH
jgi:hypothetical protein